MKTTTPPIRTLIEWPFLRAALIFIGLVLACIALPGRAQAVSPAPDGGYPGGNTAEGQNALLSLSTGTYNTAIGIFSLLSLTDGKFCTGVGAGTLLANTAVENTATGAGALLSNTTGADNTANGAFALVLNTEGSGNTADGFQALFSNTTGGENTANGFGALDLNATGNENTAIGASALQSNTGGNGNTAIGFLALGTNTTGGANTAFGEGALENNTTGDNNVAMGAGAGTNQDPDASNNIYIGNPGGAGDFNTIAIGSPGIHTSLTYIQGIFGATLPSGVAVFIDDFGHLGTLTSSARFKRDIRDMADASQAILGLRPVSFRYKPELDPDGIPQFGLVAEEVEKVNPALVVRNKEGKPYSVRYDQVNAMLLNEFLKEHKKIEEQQACISELNSKAASEEARIDQQQKGIEVLSAQLKEQAVQIQNVSAQVKVNKFATGRIRRGGAATSVALNNP
jgi:hypothetical protein